MNKKVLSEEKKKRDRCLRIADRKYDKPSAYKSGAVVRCRKGDIWKGLKENEGLTDTNFVEVEPYSNGTYMEQYPPKQFTAKNGDNLMIYMDDKSTSESSGHYCAKVKTLNSLPCGCCTDDTNNTLVGYIFVSKDDDSDTYRCQGSISDAIQVNEPYRRQGVATAMHDYLNEMAGITTEMSDTDSNDVKAFWDNRKQRINEKESLHKWFKRQGGEGKSSGWVDCNTCKKDKNGKKKCKSCGRQKGEERSKYPSCRPTPSACSDKGKGKNWGKTK